jgi:carboxymethylenebutenolidase
MSDIRLARRTVSLETASTPMDAYVARPDDDRPHPGVIVGFELFGLTPYIRRTADDIARRGYLVVVPDFYHRSGKSLSLEADDAGRRRGFQLLDELDRAKVLADVETALDFLRGEPRTSSAVGFVGFSTGAHIGFLAATQADLRAVVAFYPGWLTVTDISLSRPEPTAQLGRDIPETCNVLILIGEDDRLNPEPVREELARILQSQGARFELVVYEGAAHGFVCDERTETYNATAATAAWDRVAGFLESNLRQ